MFSRTSRAMIRLVKLSLLIKKNQTWSSAINKPLIGKRILVRGKGGCGKSSIVSMMAHTLQDESYKVIVLDGDASNPGGLARLMFGSSQGPKPLISFFGGRAKVECTVNDPAPLTRINDTVPITEKNIDLVLVVIDPTRESLLIAEKVADLCSQIGTTRVWTVLNKIQTKKWNQSCKKNSKEEN